MAAPDLIIGLGHRKRVGKDTFANYLSDKLAEHGYAVHRLAFAEAMKAATANIFGVYGLHAAAHYEAHPALKESPLPEINKSPRQIWIEFCAAMHSIDPDIWVKLVGEQIAETRYAYFRTQYTAPLAFIITDVRFPNEAAAIKSWGGVLLNIVRPSVPKTDDVADCALNGYQGWDHTIANLYSLDVFKATAREIAQHLIKGII